MRQSFKDIITKAHTLGYGVPAINVSNYETVMALFLAAENKKSPIIIQVAHLQLEAQAMSWTEFMTLIRLAESRYPNVVFALHLDHAETLELCETAIQQGFDSVMFDGSARPFEENLSLTKRLRKKYPDVSIEAEVGALGEEAGHHQANQAHYLTSDPNQAIRMAREVDIQGLALAIGNAHGFYKGEPKLDFDLLKHIHQAIPQTPLVLHGATGLSQEDIRQAIAQGVCKINFFTRCDYAFTKAFCDTINQGKYMMFAQKEGQKAFQKEAELIMTLCQSEGKL